ncbi:hypothetical protein BHE74_00031189 [Ensete ventricosum]|uniref:Uncharacterized protein n=1 Tax=Ensete ventricosum TaxID=4639 RepID=A0A427AL16_ENSVE|nr:hypothetical protein B296_00027627 [Ensete ventricosum]RWW61762.1 hypothetical protein BHE74_00031189 [Ensete ventricosum]RZS08606.1 hypothetical protein BHM03_00039613 [Ensete ventricosum]
MFTCFNIFVHCFGSYIDPEAVIGCEDGRVRVFDMYSGRCSRIIRYKYLCLTKSFLSAGLKCLSFNMHSYSVFAGSTSGYAHCWDIRLVMQILSSIM